MIKRDLPGREHLTETAVTIDAGRTAAEARTAARIGECRFTARNLDAEDLGGEPGRLLGKEHGTADLEFDFIGQAKHILSFC